MFKRLFRVYAHSKQKKILKKIFQFFFKKIVYHSHFTQIVSLGEEAHLNTSFKVNNTFFKKKKKLSFSAAFYLFYSRI